MTTPTGYLAWDRPAPLLDRLGDLRRHETERGVYGFVVDESKLNARGFLHAGAISTIADVCIGHTLAGETDPPTPLVTINLTVTFVGKTNADQWVDVLVRPCRVGRRLATGTAEFHVDDRVVAHASATFLPANPRVATNEH